MWGGILAEKMLWIAYFWHIIRHFTYYPPQDGDCRPPWDGSRPNRSKRPRRPSIAHHWRIWYKCSVSRRFGCAKFGTTSLKYLLLSALHGEWSESVVVTAGRRWGLEQSNWPLSKTHFCVSCPSSICWIELEQNVLWIACSWHIFCLWSYWGDGAIMARHWRRPRGGLLAWKSTQLPIFCFGTFLWIH